MSRLTQKLQEKDTHLIPFLVAGDPDIQVTRNLIRLLEEEGVSAIEVGVPFSDPMADGPVIQASSERALANGTTLSMVLKMSKELREEGVKVPLILFSYANPIYQYGLRRLVQDAVQAGFDGLIVPDFPYEESGELRQLGKEAGLAIIPLVAPTSHERIGKIVKKATGFVYCVSSLGTTGVRNSFNKNVDQFLQTVRMLSPVPTAVGFGISERKHVEHFSALTDAIIVGSALVKLIEKNREALQFPETTLSAYDEIRKFVRELKSR